MAATPECDKHPEDDKPGWKIVRLILEFTSLAGLILGYWYHTDTIAQYEEQQIPEVEVRYFYNTEREERNIVVTNIGLVDCDRVWVSESVYFIINETVYEGIDVPHLDHFVYHGSKNNMWPIEKSESKDLEIVELQTKAFEELYEQYKAIPICRWRVEYSSNKFSKTYINEQFFIYDIESRRYRTPSDHIGGTSYVQAVEDYIRSGPPKTIQIHPMTNNFDLYSPTEFLITVDYNFIPLFPGKTVSLDVFQNALGYFSALGIQPSDDLSNGSLRYAWSQEMGSWCKKILQVGDIRWFSKRLQLQPELKYLSIEDRKKLEQNPSLLGNKINITLDIASDCSNSNDAIEKARIKFMSNM
jgi:hypothetical protein